jgi:hypothetical protein
MEPSCENLSLPRFASISTSPRPIPTQSSGDTDACSLKQAVRGFQLRSDPQNKPTFAERLS